MSNLLLYWQRIDGCGDQSQGEIALTTSHNWHITDASQKENVVVLGSITAKLDPMQHMLEG